MASQSKETCLRIFGDQPHHFYGPDGVLAHGRFFRQHDRVSSIQDGIGHVGYLGPGGPGLSTMDLSIWVAVMANLPERLAFLMSVF